MCGNFKVAVVCTRRKIQAITDLPHSQCATWFPYVFDCLFPPLSINHLNSIFNMWKYLCVADFVWHPFGAWIWWHSDWRAAFFHTTMISWRTYTSQCSDLCTTVHLRLWRKLAKSFGKNHLNGLERICPKNDGHLFCLQSDVRDRMWDAIYFNSIFLPELISTKRRKSHGVNQLANLFIKSLLVYAMAFVIYNIIEIIS